MGIIKERFRKKADEVSAEIKEIIKTHGHRKIGEVTLAQVYQGMRGITGLVSETSLLDANEGIRFRGYSIPELQVSLPKVKGGNQPLPEGLFYLMLLGTLPTEEEVNHVTSTLQRRSHVPNYVFDTIESLPVNAHPMTQFVVGIMALQTQSSFAKRYAEGMSKKDYWEATYDDALDLIARLPRIAAYIYRRKYRNGDHIQPNGLLDWSGNFAHMMGYDDETFKELMRLYMTIHADHEGGNVSAHTTHLVGSALSDPFLSFAAGMNGLAGPLHGLANQEVVKWIFEMREQLGVDLPSNEQIEQYVRKTLSEGKVVPGYGHAVLRKTDPRFMCELQFADQYIKDDNLINLVKACYKVIPQVLEATGKVSNPWPNVDAGSGALLMHFGLKQEDYYTVLFGVSRAFGVMAAQVWSRALGLPIERPNSFTLEHLIKKVEHDLHIHHKKE